MRSIRSTALAAFTLALAVGAVGACSASAAEIPEWYSAKPAPEWQQEGKTLTEAVPVQWKVYSLTRHMIFADEGFQAEVVCEVTGEGSDGAGAAGKITSLTLSKCEAPSKYKPASGGEEVVNTCEESTSSPAKVKFVNLPWRTELVTTGGAQHDLIKAEGKEEPGFVIECKVGGLKKNDTCLLTATNKLSPTVSNASPGVFVSFEGGHLKCSASETEQGGVIGSDFIEATKGSKLEVNVVDGPFTKLTSSLAVVGKGTLGVEEKAGGLDLGFKCSVETEGTSEAGGKGTISNVKISNCAGVKECGSLLSLSEDGLPWTTALAEAEGAIADKLTGSKEASAWSFECSDGGIKLRDKCPLTVLPELQNGVGGVVDAIFPEDSASLTTCSDSVREGASWQGEIKFSLTNGEALEVKK